MEKNKKQYVKPQIAQLSAVNTFVSGKGGDANEGNPSGMAMLSGMQTAS